MGQPFVLYYIIGTRTLYNIGMLLSSYEHVYFRSVLFLFENLFIFAMCRNRTRLDERICNI